MDTIAPDFCFWDEYESIFGLRGPLLSNDLSQDFYFVIYDLDSVGSYTSFRLEYAPNNDAFLNSYHFRVLDSTYQVQVSQVSSSSVSINFSVLAFNPYKIHTETVNLSGNMTFER